jgi:hypothetical protein
MHASEAFLNGAAANGTAEADLEMLNTLLATHPLAASASPVGMLSQSSGAQRSEERPESQGDEATEAGKEGRFQNDPPDPSNPNEVREQHLKKVKQLGPS